MPHYPLARVQPARGRRSIVGSSPLAAPKAGSMASAYLREALAARELLELRLVGVALDALVTALRLEHPTLLQLFEPTDPPTLLSARRLVLQVRHLRAALRAYRATVRRSLVAPGRDDDLPF